jgi:hypothetical protein
LADPLAVSTSHSTLSWVGEVVLTACIESGIAAAARDDPRPKALGQAQTVLMWRRYAAACESAEKMV